MDFYSICEATIGDIKRKHRSVTMLFPTFDDRVKNVQLMGGVRLKDIDDDNWHFQVHSGTKKEVWYDCTLHFKDIQEQLERLVKDRRLWVEDRSRVDLRKLAVEFIEKANVQVFCSCPAFLYYGSSYILGRPKYDAKYTEPENRPPRHRNLKQYGAVCKHYTNVLKALPFYTGTVAKWLRDVYARDIAGYQKEAMKDFGWFQKAAGALTKRKARTERPEKASRRPTGRKPEHEEPEAKPTDQTQPETPENAPPSEPENERIIETVDVAYKRLWGKTTDGLSVYIVNGELIRDDVSIEFTEGGHDLRYGFIPKNEVWIEDMKDPAEHEFILLHELHERNLMKSKGLDYETAHEDANRVEKYARSNQNEIGSMLAEEGWTIES